MERRFGVQLQNASGSRSLGPESRRREVSAAAAGEGIHEAAEGKKCFSIPAWARNLWAQLELHLHLPEAWRGQERGPRAPHPALQKKEGNAFFVCLFVFWFLGFVKDPPVTKP